MIRQFFSTAVRSLNRNRISTFANIFGLSLALLGNIVVYQIISFERSFDDFHNDGDRIYRLVRITNEFGETGYSRSSPYPFTEAIRSEFPDCETVTTVDALIRTDVFAVPREDGSFQRFSERGNIAFVEPQYFDLFSRTWVAGSPETALNDPGSVVLSESIAKKHFGDSQPMGKTILVDSKDPVTVTGIVTDAPPNTNLPFNILIAFDSEKRVDKNWSNNYGPVQCYIRLRAGVSPDQVESAFPAFLRRHLKEDDARVLTLKLQPLNEIHFDTRFGSYNRMISEGTLWALLSIAAGLLIVACVNAINLLSARAADRMKEMSMRRILGSSRMLLALQVYVDALLIVLASLLIALVAADTAIMYLDVLLGYNVGEFSTFGGQMPFVVVALAFVMVVASGSIPAFLLSRASVGAPKSRAHLLSGSRFVLRRTLVVLQFVVSQVLIVAGLVINEQSSYLVDADMGFDREAVVEVPLHSSEDNLLALLKTRLLSHPEIRSVSFSNTGTASNDQWGGDFSYNDGKQLLENHADIKFIDNDYLTTYGLTLVAGQQVTREGPRGFLVNEALVRALGFGSDVSSVLGGKLSIWAREAPIAGVMKDFHSSSLKDDIVPLVFVPENKYVQGAVKVNTGDLKPAVEAIRAEWSAAYPDKIFGHSFLDDTIRQFYEAELRIGTLITVLTTVAIVIGSLGLLGLTSFLARQRRKEIGIRKVLGASVSGVVGLLSREFLLLVAGSSLIGWPVAYVLMSTWLETYAYRIDISPGMFIVAGVASVGIAFVAISGQVVKAARANPVESLRYE